MISICIALLGVNMACQERGNWHPGAVGFIGIFSAVAETVFWMMVIGG